MRGGAPRGRVIVKALYRKATLLAISAQSSSVSKVETGGQEEETDGQVKGKDVTRYS